MATMTIKTRETFDGGYDYIIRLIARETPDECALRERLWNHYDTPECERGAFWQGVNVAIREAIDAMVGEEA